MTSPSHARNRFGFQSSPVLSQTGSTTGIKLSPRFTPSPTKNESPRSVINNNHAMNGNDNMRSNGNDEKSVRLLSSPQSNPSARGAYLCLKQDFSEDVSSQKELKQLLQIFGHNPTEDLCSQLWGGRSRMNYSEFEKVLDSMDPVPSEEDLIDIFRKLDPSNRGTIPKSVLVEALSGFGDRMSPDRVIQVLDDGYMENFTHLNLDEFDYRSFCEHAKSTSRDLMALARELANTSGHNYAVNSKTYRVRKKSSSPQKVGSVWSNHCTTLKGAFYFEADSMISHQYTLTISQTGKYQISIHPTQGFNVDCQLFIFRVNDSMNANRNADSRFTLIDRTPLVVPTKKRKDDELILQNSSSWQGNLDQGTYLLVPSTTGCKLKKRCSQPPSDVELVTIHEKPIDGLSRFALSDKFKKALREIFYQVDLDSNGTLSREEFNLFNWRTSGEEVQDDEWKVVSDNFSLENGELTLDGFLKLHQMEAEDNGGDSAELWVTLNAMGFNHALEQDEIALFEVSVYNETGIEPVNLCLSGLKSGGPLLDKATIRCIMDGTQHPKIVDAGRDVILFREDTPSLTSVVLQNKSPTAVTLSMDFTNSSNVLINHPHLKFSTTLSARSTLFVAQLIPENPNSEFKPDLSVSFLR